MSTSPLLAEQHPIFRLPTDRNVKIWRYMDFGKFVDLLERRSLFFARADLLGDRFEGSSSAADIQRLRSFMELGREDFPPDVQQLRDRERDRFLQHCADGNRRQRSWTYVSCWHMNEHESAAMWKIYAMSSQAIAIRSTYSLLRACLPDDQKQHPCVYIGEVQYLGHESCHISGNAFAPFTVKRQSFSYEQELRALVMDMSMGMPLEPIPVGRTLSRL